MELRAGVNVCSVTSLVRAGTFMGRAAGTGRSPWRGDLVRGGTRSSSQPRASERDRETHFHQRVLPPPLNLTTLVARVVEYRACLLASSSFLPLRRRRRLCRRRRHRRHSEHPASHRRLSTTGRYSCGQHPTPTTQLQPLPTDSLTTQPQQQLQQPNRLQLPLPLLPPRQQRL